MIDRKFKAAAMWAFASAVLSFFGFIHGTQLGWAMSPKVTLGALWPGVPRCRNTGEISIQLSFT